MFGAETDPLETVPGHGVHSQGTHTGFRSYNWQRGQPCGQDKAKHSRNSSKRCEYMHIYL